MQTNLHFVTKALKQCIKHINGACVWKTQNRQSNNHKKCTTNSKHKTQNETKARQKCHTKPASFKLFRMMISLTALNTLEILSLSVAHVTCV